MNIRVVLFSVLSILSIGMPEPVRQDSSGWGKALWGMKTKELKAAFAQEGAKEIPRMDFEASYCILVLDSIGLEGKPYHVRFIMDAVEKGLRMVTLQNKLGADVEVFTALRKDLIGRYGKPSLENTSRGNGESPSTALLHINISWKLPHNRIELDYLDMGMDGMPRQLVLSYECPPSHE